MVNRDEMLSSSGKPSGFWAKGRPTYLKELKREKAEILASLRTELEEATDPIVKEQVRERIMAVMDEYERKRRGSDSNLFIK